MIKNNFFVACISAAAFFSNALNAQCAPVSEFSENFDSYSCCGMGVVPTCWNSIMTQGGNQIISGTSPASGTSQIYQTGYGTGKISIVVMPSVTNINAGTHHFRFKVKASSGPGLLDFGYITDTNDISTFVTLQSLQIFNSSYDNTSERILAVPTTVPANARLAIRNSGATWAGHYWDDAIWELKSNLGLNEISKETVKIYPNPFQNNLNISDIKNVKYITINDSAGRIVKTIEKPSEQLDLEELKAGFYFVNIYFEDENKKTVKVIKN